MQIENNVIVGFDKTDKHLFIPKTIVGADYAIADLHIVEGFDSITVEEGNKHFYMQDGCLIWRDKKALMLAEKGAKIPDDGSVTTIAGGAFMYRNELKEIEIPASIEKINHQAFGCTELEKVTLHEGLKELDAYAFGCNEHLTELTIPKSVTKIVTHKVLEDVKMIAEYGYKNKTYRVYKDTYAHRFMKRNHLQFTVIEEKKMQTFVKASDMIAQNQLPDKNSGLYCLIGQAENGEVHFSDITKAPHILVGGYSGSGKSIFLRGVVLSVIMNYTPDEVGLILLDTKQHCEFVVYDNTPHVLGKELTLAEEELDRRLASAEPFEKKIVVIIDEYAELSRNPQTRKTVEKLLQYGAGVGIHVVMATQRLAKDVITPAFQASLSTIVCCRVGEKSTSKFALGKYGAEKLLGKGDMLYKDGGGNIAHLQAGYVFERDTQEVVERIKEKYA